MPRKGLLTKILKVGKTPLINLTSEILSKELHCRCVKLDARLALGSIRCWSGQAVCSYAALLPHSLTLNPGSQEPH